MPEPRSNRRTPVPSRARPIATVRAGRAPLSRERVVRAAVLLADKAGIDGLTMRSLGQSLGIEAMSLYNHVSNKDDLLDGMVDVVFGEIGLPPVESDWKAALRQRAVNARTVLACHLWAIGLMESRRRPGPATLQHHDAVLGCLRRAGFSVEAAAHAYSLLDSYVYGFTLNEQSLPFEASDNVAEVGATMLPQFSAHDYRYLVELMMEYAARPGYRYGDEFGFGLDLILDGLEQLRQSN